MIESYDLRIELLSDLCVSDGGIYNSMLDTDICHDEYGFPYIPGKRIKGCLRECGLELADWDEDPESKYELVRILFGSEGKADKQAKVRVENAYLVDYDEKLNIVSANAANGILHPQNILDHFSYIRTQTAINYETGVADETSLRTMRVANKGLEFKAAVILDGATDKEKSFVKDCCRILKHIGVSRTRGLGEIRAELTDDTHRKESDKTEHAEYVPGTDRLHYEIKIKEPVICKSVNAGEAYTLDYIEGNKILGILINGLKRKGEDYLDFVSTENKLICSNAYLSVDGSRTTEVPGYIYSIKNDKDNCVNKLYSPDKKEERQLNQMKHCYVLFEDNKLIKSKVKVENRYHHRRPEDKGIGRAIQTSYDDSVFYQMSSISKGQVFRGFICGTEQQIKKAYDLLSEKPDVYIGYSASAEYGKALISVTSVDSWETEKISSEGVVIRLNAPTIIYSDKAMPTTDPVELEKEILNILGLSEDIEYEVNRFIKYTTIGGYNVTWNMRKPTINTFDKGTALIFHFPSNKLAPKGIEFIGERTSEGYGEISIETIDPNCDGYEMVVKEIKNDCHNQPAPELDVSDSSFLNNICEETMKEYIKASAVIKAQETFAKRKDDSWRPTVSNMLLLLEECNTIKDVKDGIDQRFDGKKSKTKQDKLENANRIMEETEKGTESLANEFSIKYNIKGFHPDANFVRMTYLKTYLIHAKYMLRRENSI